MKSISLILTVILASAFGFGSVAQPLNSFEAGGIKVIHNKVDNPVVAVRLYVRGGTANYPIDQQGIENLAFDMALFGDSKKITSKDKLNRASELGIGFSSKSGYDYGYMGMTALHMFWDESWELWSTAVAQPAFDETDANYSRGEMNARIREIESSPNQLIEQRATAQLHLDTDYEKIPLGTIESLAEMSAESIAEYYNRVVNKSNIFLVVTGNIETEDLKQKVNDAFAALPDGAPTAPITPVSDADFGIAQIHHKDLDVNHLLLKMPAPARYGPEGVANMLAMSLLSDRLHEAARQDDKVFYAPTATADTPLRFTSNSIYTMTDYPANSIDLIIKVINQIRKTGFTAEELSRKKASFLTYLFLGQETVDAHAHALGDAEAAGEWRQSLGILEDVNSLNIGQVNSVFRKYSNKVSWFYLGNESQITTSEFKQPVALD